jgi:hypothetical protein
VSPLLLALIALLTYGSRAFSLVFLPRPSPRFEAFLSRMPAPIFASLATLTLIPEAGRLAGGPVLLAALGALAASPRHSLAACLVAGLACYVVGRVVLGPG